MIREIVCPTKCSDEDRSRCKDNCDLVSRLLDAAGLTRSNAAHKQLVSEPLPKTARQNSVTRVDRRRIPYPVNGGWLPCEERPGQRCIVRCSENIDGTCWPTFAWWRRRGMVDRKEYCGWIKQPCDQADTMDCHFCPHMQKGAPLPPLYIWPAKSGYSDYSSGTSGWSGYSGDGGYSGYSGAGASGYSGYGGTWYPPKPGFSSGRHRENLAFFNGVILLLVIGAIVLLVTMFIR